MNVIVVDTSSWISFFKGTPSDDLDLGLKEGRVHLPAVVAAELLSSQLTASERTALVSFLKDLPLCDASFEHWTRVGTLRATLARKGLYLSTPDAHVAQCAIDLNGYLMTEDAVFKKAATAASLRLLQTHA